MEESKGSGEERQAHLNEQGAQAMNEQGAHAQDDDDPVRLLMYLDDIDEEEARKRLKQQHYMEKRRAGLDDDMFHGLDDIPLGAVSFPDLPLPQHHHFSRSEAGPVIVEQNFDPTSGIFDFKVEYLSEDFGKVQYHVPLKIAETYNRKLLNMKSYIDLPGTKRAELEVAQLIWIFNGVRFRIGGDIESGKKSFCEFVQHACSLTEDFSDLFVEDGDTRRELPYILFYSLHNLLDAISENTFQKPDCPCTLVVTDVGVNYDLASCKFNFGNSPPENLPEDFNGVSDHELTKLIYDSDLDPSETSVLREHLKRMTGMRSIILSAHKKGRVTDPDTLLSCFYILDRALANWKLKYVRKRRLHVGKSVLDGGETTEA